MQEMSAQTDRRQKWALYFGLSMEMAPDFIIAVSMIVLLRARKSDIQVTRSVHLFRSSNLTCVYDKSAPFKLSTQSSCILLAVAPSPCELSSSSNNLTIVILIL